MVTLLDDDGIRRDVKHRQRLRLADPASSRLVISRDHQQRRGISSLSSMHFI